MKIVLQATGLSKTYNPGTRTAVKAVQQVDFELRRGEITMIMGPSGGGKTTLLTMFGGLLTPTAGSIFINGTDITQLNRNALTRLRRDQLGFIFQSFNLLENLTAVENVSIAGFHQTDRQKRAIILLKKLGLGKRLDAKPKHLSGGERQRVAIARALINNPTIILADEPTANLDTQTGSEVMKILCSIGCEQGRSIVIVSHDGRIKDIAHRVVYIEDGKFRRSETGRHDRVCSMKKHAFPVKNKRKR